MISALYRAGTAIVAVLFAVPAPITYQYTDISDRACRKLTVLPAEEDSATFACPGVAGYRLVLEVGDLRENLRVVGPDRRDHDLELWTIVAQGFSGLGRTAEWRLTKGRPFAIIVRYNVSENPDDSSVLTSYLVVARLSTTSTCVTHKVGPGPNQNAQARRFADASAKARCLT